MILLLLDQVASDIPPKKSKKDASSLGRYMHKINLTLKITIIIIIGVKLPPVVKTRGRPKGHNLTTVGLH